MLFRCRICDEEYTVLEVLGILDDDLCPKCEDEVLSTMAEWEEEERNDS